jgi:hypothetical protein
MQRTLRVMSWRASQEADNQTNAFAFSRALWPGYRKRTNRILRLS